MRAIAHAAHARGRPTGAARIESRCATCVEAGCRTGSGTIAGLALLPVLAGGVARVAGGLGFEQRHLGALDGGVLLGGWGFGGSNLGRARGLDRSEPFLLGLFDRQALGLAL